MLRSSPQLFSLGLRRACASATVTTRVAASALPAFLSTSAVGHSAAASSTSPAAAAATGTATGGLKVDKELLQRLRKESTLPFNLCHEALLKNNNDYTLASTWLEKRATEIGRAKMEKLKDRVAAQGIVAVCAHEATAAVIELNCETDFVARNPLFVNTAKEIAANALQVHAGQIRAGAYDPSSTAMSKAVADAADKARSDAQASRAVGVATGTAAVVSPLPQIKSSATSVHKGEASTDGSATGIPLNQLLPSLISEHGQTVFDRLVHVVGRMGEKVDLRSASVLDVSHVTVSSGIPGEDKPLTGRGVVGVYTHGGEDSLCGAKASAVALVSYPPITSATPADTVKELSKIAHGLAVHVLAHAPTAVEKVSAERATLKDDVTQVAADAILLEQPYFYDTSKKVQQVLEEAGKRFEMRLIVRSFTRMVAGEGIEVPRASGLS
ncbi:hypothetical protein CAOG_03592 [Capsaspora owczarzaki ATCC 30864]|uniref:Elongation factor Ts, mitochondrial n=1 Tax=Capsaspora owczarzaki (strain ATCC 30864) TaxID=595528 RepID=A0A0D2WPP5_CAPO3|nr:hypothetical protein CAOG_03592 [Capsaspora owczarzaki ATCC 30864]KJE92673.1 hypothetical protein CAOG_003592 [Capsaspora owczarzaki ATCC 30864]|eukprot:XP_004363320.1 hypothetical protein CAOG_03592 [Capsaspora owczarzaki ATCC 30864]